MASVSCHRWLLSESALINVWNLSRGRSIVGSSGVDIGDGNDPALHDLIESVAVLTKTCKDWRRVLGENHPYTSNILGCLSRAQEKLADARAAASNKSKPPP